MDGRAAGIADAERDFANVGTDFALNLATGAEAAITLHGISPAVAVKREIAGFRRLHEKEWLEDAKTRAFDPKPGSSGAQVDRYAEAYVSRYLELIEKMVVAEVKEALKRAGKRAGERVSHRARTAQLTLPMSAPSLPARRLVAITQLGHRANVASVEDARDKWERVRDSSGAGVSEIGNGVRVEDESGNHVADISYNGRIWPAGSGGPGPHGPFPNPPARADVSVMLRAAQPPPPPRGAPRGWTAQDEEDYQIARGESGGRIASRARVMENRRASRAVLDTWDAWFRSLPEGAQLHYNGGFGDFTAAVKVGDPLRPGWGGMKKVALIGNWKAYDLDKYRKNPNYPYDPQEGPQRFGGQGTIVEHPTYSYKVLPYDQPIRMVLGREIGDKPGDFLTLVDVERIRRAWPDTWMRLLADAPRDELKRRADRAVGGG